MDQERTLLIVVAGVAVAVGCFVLWGPSTFRSKRRKGHVIGLMNLGHTCFLNTLLQALASCPSVLDWLFLHQNEIDDSLISALQTVLLVLNGDHSSDTNISDPYPPTEVISALRRHNWVISPGEQDAHELFHVLLETLEEEMMSSSVKGGSLSDILLPERSGQGDSVVGVSDKIRTLSQSTKVKCDGDQNSLSSGFRFRPIRRIQGLQNHVPLPVSSNVERLPQQSPLNPPPFRGMLTSQLKCTSCGFKSALRYDKFDTLSLPLPSPSRREHLTLQMLLDNFVSTEVVKDVTCTNCSKGKEQPVQTTAMKTLNFGKLPKCLCLHIVRTTMNKDGQPWKREDYVDFPEFLTMDNYTHNQVQLNARKLVENLRRNERNVEEEKEKVNFSSDLSNGCVGGIHLNGNVSQNSSEQNNHTPLSAKHMYRLKAVVVHTGDIHSGHFITYRKGPVKSMIRHRLFSEESEMEHPESRESTRWFYTSDVVVRRATLCDALLSNAYMLFYEKCTQLNNGCAK